MVSQKLVHNLRELLSIFSHRSGLLKPIEVPKKILKFFPAKLGANCRGEIAPIRVVQVCLR